MPIELIKFKDKEYPAFQSRGNAMQWVLPFAKEVLKDCKKVVDIGCNRKEWAFPDATAWDMNIEPERHAMNLPEATTWDAIVSSHMLEHFAGNWMTCLDYWLTKIKVGGIIFLYLPHKSQEYWLPENNRRHIHSFEGSEIEAYLKSLGHKVIRSGVDLNNSFVVVCEKVDAVSDDERLKRCADAIREVNYADEKEQYCKERNISYIREGNNVIYNEPSCIKYDEINAHGDILMKSCFNRFNKDSIPYFLHNHKSDGGIVSGELLDELKNKEIVTVQWTYTLEGAYNRYNAEAKHKGDRQVEKDEFINIKLSELL